MTTITDLILKFADPTKQLYISYNDHWSVYETIEQCYRHASADKWVDYEAAVERNAVWEVVVYDGDTRTYHRLASTLASALGGPENGEPCAVAELIERALRGLPNSFYINFNEHSPEIYGDLILEHAEHDAREWISDDDYLQALMTNHVWEVRYYPDTPVGFCSTKGATLENALKVMLA
jgi:hypothetical protein